MSMRRRRQTGAPADWDAQAQDPWADAEEPTAAGSAPPGWPGEPRRAHDVTPFPTFADAAAPPGPLTAPENAWTKWPAADNSTADNPTVDNPTVDNPTAGDLDGLFGDEPHGPTTGTDPWALGTDDSLAPSAVHVASGTSTQGCRPTGGLDDLFNDDRFNDDRLNDDRLNDDRLNDDRFNDDRLNDDRLNDDRFNDDRLNGPAEPPPAPGAPFAPKAAPNVGGVPPSADPAPTFSPPPAEAPADPFLPVATGRQAGPSLAALAGIAPSAGPAAAPGTLARRPDRLPERTGLSDELTMLYQRIGRSDSLWSAVDQILAAISPNGAIQAFVTTLELTRDHALMAQQRAELEARVRPTLLEAGIHIRNPHDQQLVFDMLYNELVGISVLGPFWVDDRVTEIMVNGFDDVTIEIGSEVHLTPVRFKDARHAQRVALELARKISDRGLTRSNPIVTAELPGARITLVTDPVVKSGISINLRKFPPLFGMRQLLELGALTHEMADFLRRCVEARATILISGGTGSGKTTQINALSEFIPSSERVITIEDAFELSLSNKHVVSLQTKEKASADDPVVIGQAELLVAALRMRPDRIIVGEVRESAGALTMLQAANTGHDGTMTTVHANSASAALNERMAELIRAADGRPPEVAARSIASAIDLVVHVTRRRGRRYVAEIAVVDVSGVQGNEIVPEPVFEAELDPHGNVQVAKVGDVRPDTDLGIKLADHTALGEATA